VGSHLNSFLHDLQEMLDEDMPELPDYVAPLEETDISIELQFPSLGDVSTMRACITSGVLASSVMAS